MKISRDRLARYTPLVIIAIAAAVPFLSGDLDLLNLLTLMLIFIIFSSAWNLLAHSGQGSLGHAAFFGIGAYASTLIAIKSGIPPVISIFFGAAVAAFIGILIGLTCFRLREWFLAMVTFGFAIIVQTIMVSLLAPLSGGWDGMASPRLVSPSIPGYQVIEYYAILLITIGCILAIHLILRSRIGLAFSAIRENETEARAAGVDPYGSGSLPLPSAPISQELQERLRSTHIGYITPEIFGVDISFWPVIYVIFGGLGTLAGPVIGTVVLMSTWEGLKLGGFTFGRYIIIGVLLILVIIFLPRGLVSIPASLRRYWSAWKERRNALQEAEKTD